MAIKAFEIPFYRDKTRESNTKETRHMKWLILT